MQNRNVTVKYNNFTETFANGWPARHPLFVMKACCFYPSTGLRNGWKVAASVVSEVSRIWAGQVLFEVWPATWAVHGGIWICMVLLHNMPVI